MISAAKVTSLEAALAIVQKMEAVARAYVWNPSKEKIEECKAQGFDAKPTLVVTLWREQSNPADVKIEIESLGLECVDDGTTIPNCFSFALRN